MKNNSSGYYLTYVRAAELSWHVQIRDMAGSSEWWLKQKKVFKVMNSYAFYVMDPVDVVIMVEMLGF